MDYFVTYKEWYLHSVEKNLLLTQDEDGVTCKITDNTCLKDAMRQAEELHPNCKVWYKIDYATVNHHKCRYNQFRADVSILYADTDTDAYDVQASFEPVEESRTKKVGDKWQFGCYTSAYFAKRDSDYSIRGHYSLVPEKFRPWYESDNLNLILNMCHLYQVLNKHNKKRLMDIINSTTKETLIKNIIGIMFKNNIYAQKIKDC